MLMSISHRIKFLSNDLLLA
uniref:Uncharacterized protein n=1 Tax=Arundo donax TaxID=35708 RepID=A0A0A8YYK4_ARUDO